MTIFPITVFSSHILSREFWCGCFFGVEFRFLPLNENIVFMIQKSKKKTFQKTFSTNCFQQVGYIMIIMRSLQGSSNGRIAQQWVILWLCVMFHYEIGEIPKGLIDMYTISWMLYDPFSFGSRCVNTPPDHPPSSCYILFDLFHSWHDYDRDNSGRGGS